MKRPSSHSQLRRKIQKINSGLPGSALFSTIDGAQKLIIAADTASAEEFSVVANKKSDLLPLHCLAFGGMLPMVLTRRNVMLGGLALAGASALKKPAFAVASSYFSGTAVDNGVTFQRTNFAKIDKRWHRQVVKYFSSEPIGTVVVDTRHHFLYLIMENKTAIRYGVGVGREGFKWFGRATIDSKSLWPRWTPPADMRKRHPELPEFVAGGSPKNPLGPRAMYLLRDGVDTGYRFHGTLEPGSIGKDASSGCIRMFNEDAIDLYQRCPIGTAVQVLPHIADQAENAAQISQTTPVE